MDRCHYQAAYGAKYGYVIFAKVLHDDVYLAKYVTI